MASQPEAAQVADFAASDHAGKVKWAHDEVCVGCAMLLAHAPLAAAAAADGGTEDTVAATLALPAWAADTLRRTLGYMDGAFRLSQFGVGSWKVGGDRWAKPDPDPATGVSGYNMGCKSLPNRVEHYHTPRMLASCIASCDRAIVALTS